MDMHGHQLGKPETGAVGREVGSGRARCLLFDSVDVHLTSRGEKKVGNSVGILMTSSTNWVPASFIYQ